MNHGRRIFKRFRTARSTVHIAYHRRCSLHLLSETDRFFLKAVRFLTRAPNRFSSKLHMM